MEFTANKNEFKAALEKVNQVCRKSAVTSTTCVKLSLSNSVLELTGYDLETGVTTHIDVDTDFSDGNLYEYLAECSKLLSIVSKQTGDEVKIITDEKDSIMTIKCGRSSCKISILPASDYPAIPEFEQKDKIPIKSDVLANMISQTIFAVAVNDNKPVLTGECFTFGGNKLEIAAVDGYRLAVRTEAVDSDYKGRFVVKSDALRAMLKLTKDSKDVNIIPCKKHAVFDFGETSLFCRLLDGDFIDYARTVPKTSVTETTVEIKPLIEALERFGLLVNDKNKAALICDISKGTIAMELKSALGEMSDIVLNTDFFGEDVHIGFSVNFLTDALKSAETDKVKLVFNGGVSPVIIKPLSGDSFTFLVLPKRLKS